MNNYYKDERYQHGSLPYLNLAMYAFLLYYSKNEAYSNYIFIISNTKMNNNINDSNPQSERISKRQKVAKEEEARKYPGIYIKIRVDIKLSNANMFMLPAILIILVIIILKFL
ncbi:4475_t:CDS:1 [Funneliformis caledonium]|uniref:4475_t:CDS:1 n=1 Tax=Funneliformis caledonium TaxID=1117310 RepID=A0A9N9AC46_9GLOM|nr:4475_t:CDS:1 [Funneliformis caledonium]